MSEAPKEDLPRSIGRYEIRRELGRGMMGIVYEARDPALGRTIALKTIRLSLAGAGREREEYERRFLAEARIAARLSHAGIVVVHDVGRDEGKGILYIALEYLHGRTLAELAAEAGRLAWRDALRVVGRVAAALHYAHGEGVVHRDIKPANIMVLRSGDPKIMDFGIAKLQAAQLTSTGQLFGTPLYMSPEQALGQPVDGRTDLFSLGSVAYTLLAGRQPFEASNVPGVLARVAYQAPAPLSQVVAGLPAEVEYVVTRAMAKTPSDRYADGKTLAEDVEDVLAGRPPRHRAAWTPPAWAEGTLVSRRGDLAVESVELQLLDEQPPARERRRRPAASLVVLLAGVTAGYFYVHPAHRQFWRGALGQVSRSSMLQGLVSLLPKLTPPEPAMPAPSAPVRPVAAPSIAPSGPAAGSLDTRPTLTGEAPVEASPTALATAPPSPATEASPAAEVIAPPEGPMPPAPQPPTQPRPSPGVLPSGRGTAAPGRLAIEFEHHLRRGNLQVWVDGERVLDEDFDGRVTRRILSLELRQGVVHQVLTLSPGRHDVRVQVKWEDNVKTARIFGIFRPGTTRRLDVQVGRLRANLGLSWK